MRYLILIILTWSVVACSKKHVDAVSTVKEEPSVMSYDQVVRKVNIQVLPAKFVQAKGQVSMDEGGFFSSGSLVVRSIRDSLLWFSVTKLGFEVARGLIRNDSAFAVNHWEKEYWMGSLQDISLKYKVPAGFKDIQSLLLPHLEEGTTYQMKALNSSVQLEEAGALNRKFIVAMPTALIESIMISHTNSDIRINYSDYASLQGAMFPYTHIHLVRNDNVTHQTKIKFSQVEPVLSVNTPFVIPAEYDQMK